MYIKAAAADTWINLASAGQVTITQDGSDWHVRAGTFQGPLIRTLASQSTAQEFVDDMLSELGLSSL